MFVERTNSAMLGGGAQPLLHRNAKTLQIQCVLLDYASILGATRGIVALVVLNAPLARTGKAYAPGSPQRMRIPQSCDMTARVLHTNRSRSIEGQCHSVPVTDGRIFRTGDKCFQINTGIAVA